MKVNVKTNIDPLLVEKLTPKADHIPAIQAQKDTEPFVPALTGSMISRTQVKDGKIIYPGPYARFLYYGKLMVDPETKNPWASKGATKELTGTDLDIKQSVHGQAQTHWFEASKAQNLDKWVRVAGKLVKDEFTE